MACKNCFISIDDMRKAVKCTQCDSPMHRDCAIKEDGAFYCDVCYTVKEEKPEIVHFEIPDAIRRTYIELYRKCPLKFLKQVIEGNEEPPSCYTQIGIDLHELFDKAVNDRSYTIEQMREVMNQHWSNYSEELFESEKQKADMRVRIDDSINTFYHVLPSIPTPFITEETIFFSIGEDIPKVRITMDLITENERGNLDMHDWKTGAVMVGQNLSSDLQAPLYIKAVQENYHRQVDSFTFYYLKDNKTRVFERIDNENYVCRVGKREYKVNLTDAIREVQSLFAQIKKGNFNIPRDTRKMYFTCKMCHIKKAGLCRGADEESWYQK